MTWACLFRDVRSLSLFWEGCHGFLGHRHNDPIVPEHAPTSTDLASSVMEPASLAIRHRPRHRDRSADRRRLRAGAGERPCQLVGPYQFRDNPDLRCSRPFLPAILGTPGLVAVAFVLRRRWPGPLAVMLCYLAILAPTSGLIRTTDQIAADRYSYLSTMVRAVAVGLARLGRARPVAMACAVALGLASAHNSLGTDLARQGRLDPGGLTPPGYVRSPPDGG